MKKIMRLGVFALALTVSLSLLCTVAYAATSLSLYSGNLTITDNNGSSGTGNETDGVTIQTKGNTLSTKTNTITFTNKASTAKVLKFSYSVSGNYESYTIGENTGTVETTLAANGGTFVCTVTAKKYFTSTATLTINNLSFTDPAASSSITVNFDSSLGSVTVGGTPATSGTAVTGVSTSAATTIVATPASGVSFLGWLNESTNTFLSTSETHTQIFGEDIALKAIFSKNDGTSVACFGVGPIKTDHELTLSGDVYHYSIPAYTAIFDNLTEANAYAVSSGNVGIVLLNNGTLTGSHSISSGVTLLIPFDSANTLYTTAPGYESDTYTTPTIYRTLTMAEGATIEVNGAISVSGKIGTKMCYNGAPSGPLGRIAMSSGSKITVNSGGNLYAWGYITGSGSVEILSDGTVYENFQIRDWRGGSVTSDMVGNSQKVFPLSQFYIQNIEVPLTLNSGATEYVSTAMTITAIGVQNPTPEFIGSDGLFVVSDGCLIKDYDENTGRTNYTLNGEVSISNLAITLNAGVLIGNITMNSSEYVLPIPSHMSLILESGNVNAAQDVALLPGSELIIGEDVTITMGSGNSLYVYDADNWGNFCYSNSHDHKYIQLIYAPGEVKDQSGFVSNDAKVVVNGVLDASDGGLYTTDGGANICSTGTGQVIFGENTANSDLITYQYSQIADSDGYGDTEEYFPISVTSAKLKNGAAHADTDPYTSTAAVADGGYGNGTYTYYAATGLWCPPGHRYESVVTAPTCTVAGYTTHTCIACGDSYTDMEVAALGHTEVIDAAVAATCTATGLTEGSHCSVCNTVLVAQEVVPATGHTEVIDAAVAATCTATGLTEGKHCSVCNAVIVAQQVVAATGHSYSSVVTPPTQTEQGYTTHTCSVCGDTYKDNYTAATGVYSVTIIWTDMNFTFTPTYTWDPETLSYGVTDGAWSTGNNVTVQNNSTASVVASLEADIEEGLSWTPTIAFVDSAAADAATISTENIEVAKNSSWTVYAKVSGTPYNNGWLIADSEDTPTTLGTITITLEKGGTS